MSQFLDLMAFFTLWTVVGIRHSRHFLLALLDRAGWLGRQCEMRVTTEGVSFASRLSVGQAYQVGRCLVSARDIRDVLEVLKVLEVLGTSAF